MSINPTKAAELLAVHFSTELRSIVEQLEVVILAIYFCFYLTCSLSKKKILYKKLYILFICFFVVFF